LRRRWGRRRRLYTRFDGGNVTNLSFDGAVALLAAEIFLLFRLLAGEVITV
jgi:hypothetical protein